MWIIIAQILKSSYNISGGRSPQRLQYVTVPVYPNSVCNSQTGYKDLGGQLTDSQLCAGNLTIGGVDSCSGDSGGPLVCDAGGFIGYVLTGVVSFAVRCGEPNFPGIYSRVTHYIEWIESKMGDFTSINPDYGTWKPQARKNECGLDVSENSRQSRSMAVLLH